MLYNRLPLVIYFTHHIVYMSLLLSRFIPPSSSAHSPFFISAFPTAECQFHFSSCGSRLSVFAENLVQGPQVSNLTALASLEKYSCPQSKSLRKKLVSFMIPGLISVAREYCNRCSSQESVGGAGQTVSWVST